ncbi:MAG: DinB family protein [candidate division Zixibacteria bacterium]
MSEQVNGTPAGVLVRQLKMISSWMPEQVKEMSSEELLYRAGGKRSHILWCIGHIIVGSDIVTYISAGESNVPDKYRELFGIGTTPKDNIEGYPPIAEIMNVYKNMINNVIETIQSLSDDDLYSSLVGDHPKTLAEYFKTRLDLVTGTIGHLTYHIGQIYFIMRMLGKPGVG